MDILNRNTDKNMTLAESLDQSLFDDRFEVEPEKDYICTQYHLENKYQVPVLSGGYSEMIEYARRNLIHHDDREIYRDLMELDSMKKKFEENGSIISAQFRKKLIDGTYRWVEYVGIRGIDNGVEEGKVYFYVYDIQNKIDRKKGQTSQIGEVKNTDPLTGLRRGLEYLPEAINKTENSEDIWCCIAIDIQHFKIFKNWFGYEKANYLLSRMGAYLLDLEKKTDAVTSYFGHDTFALFMRYDERKITEVYNDIRDLIFSYSNMLGFLPVMGVYVLKDGAKPGYNTYDNARMAAEEAKKNYKDRISYYDEESHDQKRKAIEFLSDFQNAIINDEITFYVQPQCHISSGAIVGGEVLARWIRKDGSLVNPGEFVPFLEDNGFIGELDRFIWEKTFKWIRSLIDRNINPVPVSINVSQIDLLSMDVASYLYALSANYHVSPKYIKVEITESAYAENYEGIANTINELKKKGFMVYLDDFGTGYSSLNLLDKINVDVIKLDMVFMKKDSSLGKKGMGIVESIFGMTKALELPVIVEGVENDEQLRFLKELGFKYAQGYFFYKPVSIKEFEKILNDRNSVDYKGLEMATSDLFRAQEFLKENMFTESTLNHILGAVAYYTLEGKNLTITRFNEPFRKAIGDSKMDSRIENIQNYIVELDHPALYQALKNAEENMAEGGKCEIRFFKSDDSVFWFHMHFYFLRNDGNRKLFFGKVEDTTEQREQSLHFFDVLRRQSDVTMRIELDKNRIQYITGENTLYHFDLPSMDLEKSIYQTALYRIENDNDRNVFLKFFDSERLRQTYRKAIYHEVLNINFKLEEKSEPIEFSTYYIRHNRDESLIVYAFARRRDREILMSDPLTGMNNRYAYNDVVKTMRKRIRNDEKLIVFSMDVNGLKLTNDTYGHQAGDELIKVAAEGINNVISPYGSCFRISGDEFAAFVYGGKELAEYLNNEISAVLSKWSGNMGSGVSVSCGYAALEEFPGADINELIRMADMRMYRNKSQYYQKKGVDRRMQQLAYNAICDSYTKIIKVNLTDDSFEIIRAEESELNADRGYSYTVSVWLKEFANTGNIHPEDRERYLKYTDIAYLRDYFRAGNKRYTLTYRRKINNDFCKVMMECITAPDYSDNNQKLFIYVKNIGNEESI